MDLLGGRFTLNPRPVARAAPALETAMLGHCPGRVRPERLARLTDAVEEIRQAGFEDRLKAMAAPGGAADHLPIPLLSVAEFDDIFPDARESPNTVYRSRLAGGGAWLPQAVDDFFANGGEKLWVVPVPEGAGAAGFLPRPGTAPHDPNSMTGLAVMLALPDVGLVAFPDLERIQIPANLDDIPPLQLANPAPEFLPCSQIAGDDAGEGGGETPGLPPPAPLMVLLREVLGFIARHRPDMQCLFTLPLAYSGVSGSPAVDREAVRTLEAAKQAAGGAALRYVQFLFPYLRSSRYSLRSPAGVVAGAQAAGARARGVWRSIGGQPLFSDGKPYPKVSLIEAIGFRGAPGVGVLQDRRGELALDDERLAVPALHAGDYRNAREPGRFDGFRSGEVARFIGFLLRQLRALGENLVFDADPADPRPRLLLEQFFLGLFRQGALRGRLPEQAFTISQRSSEPDTIAYDIVIAPALPIDRVTLTFVNRSTAWELEVSRG
jgi:hypothetical protein